MVFDTALSTIMLLPQTTPQPLLHYRVFARSPMSQGMWGIWVSRITRDSYLATWG